MPDTALLGGDRIGWESVNLKDRELSGKVHSAVYHQC